MTASRNCGRCCSRTLPEGPALFPDGEITDQPLEVRLTELVREQALAVTREEVPHSVAVVIDEMEREGNLTKVHASIVVERDSQKGILIGHGGQTLKTIGTQSAGADGTAPGHQGLPRPARQGHEGMAARPESPRPAGVLERPLAGHEDRAGHLRVDRAVERVRPTANFGSLPRFAIVIVASPSIGIVMLRRPR